MSRARRDAMIDSRGHGFDRSLIGGMVITEHSCWRMTGQSDFKQLPHVIFDGFGIGPAQLQLQFLATSFLMLSHPALSAQLTVREIDEKVGSFLHRDMMMNRKVLAELEGLESIDNDFMERRTLLYHLVMEEHAMAAQASDVSVDGLGGDFQVACNLSVCHPSRGFHDDLGVQVGSFLPVGCGKCLSAEAFFAGFTGKPLDTVRGG